MVIILIYGGDINREVSCERLYTSPTPKRQNLTMMHLACIKPTSPRVPAWPPSTIGAPLRSINSDGENESENNKFQITLRHIKCLFEMYITTTNSITSFRPKTFAQILSMSNEQ